MKYHKNGQFIVFSGVFLLLTLYFIYSQETASSYISQFEHFRYINNIQNEVCFGVMNSNGTQIVTRISTLETSVPIHCNNIGITCNLNILNTTPIPPSGNWTLVNYTLYNYSLTLRSDKINYNSYFTC